jgi:hypothetical protein
VFGPSNPTWTPSERFKAVLAEYPQVTTIEIAEDFATRDYLIRFHWREGGVSGIQVPHPTRETKTEREERLLSAIKAHIEENHA